MPVLPAPNPGFHLHRATQEVRVIARIRLGAFKVSVRVVEPAPRERRPRQALMTGPILLVVPIEGGRNP